MKTKIFGTLFFVALSTLAAAIEPVSSYKRIEVTINWEGDAVEDVPVLLRLSEAKIKDFKYSDVTSSGFEIVDESGNLLPYEIDTWKTEGESLIWVNLKNYANGAKLFVRYGGRFANAPCATADTWGSYVGVWHLNEMNNGNVYPNSTATEGLDGEKANASKANEAGRFGKSVMITDAVITGVNADKNTRGGVFVKDLGEASALDMEGCFTISGWFKHNELANGYKNDKLFTKRSSDSGSGGFFAQVGSEGKLVAYGNSNGKIAEYGSFTSAIGSGWLYVTFVYDATSVSVYLNGELKKPNGKNVPVVMNDPKDWAKEVSQIEDNDSPLCFGNVDYEYTANSKAGNNAWRGWIDEVRLSRGVRTMEWIKAEYHAMAVDDAVTYSDAATVDVGFKVIVR